MTESNHRKPRVIIGDSHSVTDLYYATQFEVTGPVVYVELNGQKLLLVNDLEYGRAKSEARVDEVVSTTPYENALHAESKAPTLVNLLHVFLKEKVGGGGNGASPVQITVPTGFPIGYADSLRDLGYKLEVQTDPFIPERSVKTATEIELIESAQAHAESAMSLAVDIIGAAEIRGNALWRDDEPLTAEHVRREMQKLLLDRDCEASGIIVAGGDQGADPHQRGFGPLPANDTIIIDVFPHSMTNFYWGDMTRTVVRGRASAEAHGIYEAVLGAQELAISLVKHGASGVDIHSAVVEHFERSGHKTGEENGKKVGFIHGTGHGVGLDIHELPRVGRLGSQLAAGQVVTIEPGLYYPGVGSVRLEDIVIVTENGCRNLNRFPKVLEI